MREPRPASFSTDTLAPSAPSLPTVSGVAATRFSPSKRSRTIAIFMKVSCPPARRTGLIQVPVCAFASGLDEEVEDHQRHGRNHDRPLNGLEEAVIGRFVLGIVHRRFQLQLGMV